jgi:GAF domain-containing protein
LTSDDATKAESRQIIDDLERKLAESVKQQAATSDILRVISQSPTDVRPVFDAIVQNAVRLFRCDLAFFLRRHGNTFSQAALVGSDGSHIPLDPAALPIDPEINFPSRTIVSRKNLHLPDWSAIDLPEHERRIHETYGINSSLFLPLLLRGGECFGLLALASKRPRIFGKSEISLAESFRDQAVIAIENTRLFNETQEALERQTASADVLRIISRSVAHAAPVFDTILESCQRLFNPYDAAVYLVEGDRVRGVARRGPGAGDWGADSMPLEGSSTGVAIAQRQPLHFPDLVDKADLPEDKRAVVKETGGMTVLYAPMISQDSGVGSIVVTRRPKKPFTKAEIGLIQTFADQAVIAIENARLFDEVQERTKELSQSLHDLRAAQDRLVQTEKLASLGQLTAGIAHEIKNPLNFVNNFSALSAELVEEMKDVLSDVSLDKNKREDLDEITQMLKSNLDKVVQQASGQTQSSRTCCCILGKGPASFAPWTSTRSSMRALTWLITAPEQKGLASISSCNAISIHPSARPMSIRRKSRASCSISYRTGSTPRRNEKRNLGKASSRRLPL